MVQLIPTVSEIGVLEQDQYAPRDIISLSMYWSQDVPLVSVSFHLVSSVEISLVKSRHSVFVTAEKLSKGWPTDV